MSRAWVSPRSTRSVPGRRLLLLLLLGLPALGLLTTAVLRAWGPRPLGGVAPAPSPPPPAPPPLPDFDSLASPEFCTGEHAPHALRDLAAGSGRREYCGGRVVCIHRHLDYAESFCSVTGLQLDVAMFEQFMREPLNTTEKYPYFVSPAHEPRGLLSAPGCDDWPPDRALFGKGASGLLAAALGASPPGRSCAPAPAAVTSFVAHAYERGNPWHTLEDVLHMHELTTLFGPPEPASSAVVLLDAPRGVSAQSVAFPFHPLSEAVFAPVHGYRAAHEVVDTAGGGGAAAPACVEFRTALFPPHGGSSALQRSVGLPTRCAGSPLVRGFVARAMAALPGVRDVPPAASPSDPGHTLLLVRGAAALRKVTHPAWDARVAAARASPGVRVLDPSSVPLFDQMRAVRRARRVEGQHGAALAHFMWMREGAAAVEVDKDMQCQCYHNLAVWNNVSYELIRV